MWIAMPPHAAGPLSAGHSPDEMICEGDAVGSVLLNTRDESCYLAPATLSHWLADEALLIVDTRPKEAFRRVHIPDSISLEARALVSRPYLRDHSLLLVARGFDGQRLERVCRELRDAGFPRIGILDGGIDAWWRSGRELRGTDAPQRSLGRVSPQALLRESRFDHWLLIDASEGATAGSTPLLARARHLALSGGHQWFRNRLLNLVREHREAHAATYVAVLTDDGRANPIVETVLETDPLVHLYTVDGGRAAILAAIDQQQRILMRRQRPPEPIACSPVSRR
jgi:rhodanese-related sulfurtransferase